MCHTGFLGGRKFDVVRKGPNRKNSKKLGKCVFKLQKLLNT